MPETEWLGVHASHEGFRVDKWKIEAVRDWKEPRNVKEVQSFLGFLNFYRRFIQGFSKIARPLHDLEKKDVPFTWEKKHQEAFDELKRLATSAPVLAHANPDKPYMMETDASDYAYGAVLSQKAEDGKEHPIAFLSKSLSPAERNYDIFDKEMLAVVKPLGHWRQYLQSTPEPINIITDHKNLEFFKDARITNRRQARWADLLSHYNYRISYRPGVQSGKPDALSRRSDHHPEGGGGGNDTPATIFKPDAFAEIAALYQSDAELMDQIKHIIRHDDALAPLLAYFDADPHAAPTEVQNKMKDYAYEDNVLYRLGKIYVPNDDEIKREILQLYHDSRITGHMGQAKMLELVSRGYYWPSMKAYVNRYVDGCDRCQRTKNRHSQTHGLLKPLPVPEGPWQSISYNFITNLPKSKGFDAIFVVIDRLTKMAHFVPTHKTVNAEGTVKLLMDNVWKLHGMPIQMVSDRGTQFDSNLVKGLYERLGINPTFSTAYHPQTDGQMERTNVAPEQYIRVFTSHQQDDWADLLPMAEFTYNNTIHSSVGTSPFFANCGYHPTFTDLPSMQQLSPTAESIADRIAQVQEELKSLMKIAQERQTRFYDRHHGDTPAFNVGDKVWLEATNIRTDRPASKFAAERLGPYKISDVISTHAFRLDLPATMKIHNVFHVSLLTPHRADTIPGREFDEPAPVVVDGEEQFEVDEIRNSQWL